MCALEFPDLERDFWQTYKDDGLIVVGINPGGLTSIGQTTAVMNQFIEQTGVTFPIGLDRGFDGNSSSAQAFRQGESISPFPIDVIIDRQGVVQYTRREFDSLAMQAVVKRLLAE